MIIPIKRALLSVTDKTGLIPLAQTLVNFGCELISTGGTGKCLAEAGLPYTEISTVTGNPEAFGGRMKTISFAIESALLFNRDTDAAEAAQLGIEPIDMVICNLYEFEKYRQAGAELPALIEHIDIGGPTMIRAAAKNFAYVAVVTDPGDYANVIEELTAQSGALSLTSRQYLMAKAFNLTADYDAAIAQAMDEHLGEKSLRLAFTGGRTLRYGENSHQPAVLYRSRKAAASLYDIDVLNGIEISYNNMLDLQAAVETVLGLQEYGCAIIKHNNPCGMAESASQRTALELSWAGDPVSAFGGIIALNTTADLETVQFLQLDAADKSQKKFVEIIAAPAYSAEALDYLKLHKNLRIVKYHPDMVESVDEYRVSNNALLRQTKDNVLYTKIEKATQAPFDVEANTGLIEFGLKAVRHIKSNAIALVWRTPQGEYQLLGMGSGQPNRVNSVGLAIRKAKATLGCDELGGKGIILISDAFFPFEDNVDLAKEAGIETMVQPGGSIRDKYVIARCDEFGMTMLLTGARHFKH